MFPDTAYDSATLKLLTRAFDEAWAEVLLALAVKPRYADLLRARLAQRIMNAANGGERDPKRLKLIALLALHD
jgi:hypothetical protein